MRWPVKIVLAVVLLALASIICWQVLRVREPVYQGRTLSPWLQEYVSADSLPLTDEKTATMNRAGNAVRHIGTNAVPFLVAMAGAKDSFLKRVIIIVVRNQSIIQVHLRTDKEKRQMAVFGFYALGPVGRDAVPALIDLVKDEDADVRITATDCLGNIGPDAKAAVPFLLPYLNSTNRMIAWDATVNMGRIHMEPALVVPVLVSNLTATNISMRYHGTTIIALGKFGEHAKPAIPSIVAFLNDENEDNRSAATNALRLIDPEAAAKAGVK